MSKGIFVGRSTVDVMHLIEELPAVNSKLDSTKMCMTVGGTAANAAVAFASPQVEAGLNDPDHAVLITRIGNLEASVIAREELEARDIEILDLADDTYQIPVSAIAVLSSDGSRTVVSYVDRNFDKSATFEDFSVFDDADIVFTDGYELGVALKIIAKANELNIPVVLDMGRKAASFDQIIDYIDYAIVSDWKGADWADLVARVDAGKLKGVATTRGADDVLYYINGCRGRVSVPKVEVVNTCGAGDIFHGVFMKSLVSNFPGRNMHFAAALKAGSIAASASVARFETHENIRL